MLQSKYNKYRFYCHNFGNYDVYFIFKVLLNYNLEYRKKENKDFYIIDIIMRDDKILKFIIKYNNILYNFKKL